jgi:predicted Zn-dependent protease
VLAKSSLDMLLDLHEEEKIEAGHRPAAAPPPRSTRKTPPCCATSPACTSTATTRRPPAPTSTRSSPCRAAASTTTPSRAARSSPSTIDDFEDRYDQAIDAVRSDDPQRQHSAAKFLREIIARDPRYWQPHLMLALAVRQAEGDSAALAHLMDAVRLRPNDAEIRNLLAGILRRMGRPKEAVEHLRAVVAINPRDVDPVVALASCMRDANLFDEARQVCTAALQMIPDHPDFQRILNSLPPPRERQN